MCSRYRVPSDTLLRILCPEMASTCSPERIGRTKVLSLKAVNGYVVLDFEVAGVKIPEKGVIIVKDTCLTELLEKGCK